MHSGLLMTAWTQRAFIFLFGSQRTASPSVTTSSFVALWKDYISIADRKVKSPSMFASTRETQPVSWYSTTAFTTRLRTPFLTWCTRKLPLDVLHWMTTWWARSLNVLEVWSFNICTMTVASTTTELTVVASDWVWATPSRHTSNPILPPRCNLPTSDKAGGHAWFTWRKNSSKFPPRFWQPMQKWSHAIRPDRSL